MIRILIADDHTIVRRGLREILLEGFPAAAIEEVADKIRKKYGYDAIKRVASMKKKI